MRSEDSLKERILAQSRTRFLTEGFARVSVSRLSSELAISKKTFYTVFSSKEDVVREIVRSIQREVRQNLDRILAGNQNFVGKLQAVMVCLADVNSKMSLVFGQDIQRHVPSLWKDMEAFRRTRILETFNKLVEQGVREKMIRPEINTRIFLQAYLAAIERVINPTALAGESFSAREAILGIVNMFFRGVMTGDAGRQFESTFVSTLGKV